MLSFLYCPHWLTCQLSSFFVFTDFPVYGEHIIKSPLKKKLYIATLEFSAGAKDFLPHFF